METPEEGESCEHAPDNQGALLQQTSSPGESHFPSQSMPSGSFLSGAGGHRKVLEVRGPN